MTEQLFRPFEFPRFETFGDLRRFRVENFEHYESLCSEHGQPLENQLMNELKVVDIVFDNNSQAIVEDALNAIEPIIQKEPEQKPQQNYGKRYAKNRT
jgi:hypothetical protein